MPCIWYFSIRGLRSERNLIHLNLSVSIGIFQVIFLAGIEATSNKVTNHKLYLSLSLSLSLSFSLSLSLSLSLALFTLALALSLSPSWFVLLFVFQSHLLIFVCTLSLFELVCLFLSTLIFSSGGVYSRGGFSSLFLTRNFCVDACWGTVPLRHGHHGLSK